MRFNEAPGRGPGVNWIEVKDDHGQLVPQGFVVDFSSGREKAAMFALTAGLGVAFMACMPPKHSHAPMPYSPFWTWTALAVAAVFGFLRWNLDDYRVVDAKTRKIWMHRRFFRTVSNEPEADFDECAGIVVSSRDHQSKGSKRTWTVFLTFRDGSAIELVDAQTVSMGIFSGSGDLPQATRATVDRVCRMIGVQLDFRTDWTPARLR